MADLPATTTAAPESTPEAPKTLSAGAFQGLVNLPLLKQMGVLLGLAASIAIGISIVMWSQDKTYRPLYGSLDRLDASEVVGVLEVNNIAYKLDQNSGALLVDANKIHDARLKLAAAGIPGQNAIGFELLDKEQPLGTSQFMETARYRRSLEGELSRTIASIQSVRSARVHLAIPRDSVFVRDAKKPSASVFVEVFPGRTVSKEQVRSITNLVASSISELTVEQVTVVDQKGNLLSRLAEDQDMQLANQQFEYASRYEERLVKRLHSLLEPVVGAGRFRAEVSADIDFTEVEQTDEIYNPDLPAIRSEQILEEQRKAGDAVGGVPGALSNQPPAEGSAPEVIGEAGSPAQLGAEGRRRLQATKNYELDRTISHTRHQVGRIRRLSVAVVVDDLVGAANEAGEVVNQPWTAEELDRLTTLVRDAVGFDAARGDSVNVINSSFLPTEPFEELEPLPIWQQPFVLMIAKWAGGFILVLLLIFMVLRPAMRNLSNSAQQIRELQQQQQVQLAAATAAAGGEGGDASVTLSGGENKMLPGPKENYGQQMDAVQSMIDEDPGRVAQVVKKWVADDS